MPCKPDVLAPSLRHVSGCLVWLVPRYLYSVNWLPAGICTARLQLKPCSLWQHAGASLRWVLMQAAAAKHSNLKDVLSLFFRDDITAW